MELAPPDRALCDACWCEEARRVHETNKQIFDLWWQRDGTTRPRNPESITYTLTPRRFQLDIPVEALVALGNDDHTRLIDMLNAWILRHKPPKVKAP